MSDSPTKSVASTLTLFWDIACLRRGPEELPASWPWLLATIVLQTVAGMVIGEILPALPPRSGIEDHGLALLAIELAVPLLWGAAILHLVGRPERFLQMMTAVFGFQLVIQPVIVPAIWATMYFGKQSAWLAPAQVLFLAMSVWVIVVQARIVRAATDWPVFAAVAAVIAQSLAASMIIFLLFPEMAELLKQAQ